MPATDSRHLGISRRSFLAITGLTAGTAALSNGVPGALADAAKPADAAQGFDYDTMVWSGCHVNCGSRCPLKAYVKDGTLVRVGIDDDGDDEFAPGKIYQMRSCVRGRTGRQRVYNATRVQKPLKRVEGTKRGEGVYEEIS